MNKLAVLEEARRSLMQAYTHVFSAWLCCKTETTKAIYSRACSNLVARIELVDAYIKREISQ